MDTCQNKVCGVNQVLKDVGNLLITFILSRSVHLELESLKRLPFAGYSFDLFARYYTE